LIIDFSRTLLHGFRLHNSVSIMTRPRGGLPRDLGSIASSDNRCSALHRVPAVAVARQTSNIIDTGSYFPGNEAAINRSLPCSAEAKNTWSCASVPHTSVWRVP
jgi:hypothetical protein